MVYFDSILVKFTVFSRTITYFINLSKRILSSNFKLKFENSLRIAKKQIPAK